jgi:hypothetical protein
MPGAQALRPHTAIHSITSAPPGCAGFQPACRVHRHCARIQRYTPSPLHRLGAQVSRPHAGCAGIAPAYSDTPPGYAGFQPASSDMPRGCAGVQPACRECGLPACLSDMPRLGAQASSPHAGSAGFQPAYDAPPESAGFQPASSDMPRGCAGFQPACRVHRHCARIQQYTPSPLHRLGARASSPHAGCTGIAPAYSDTPHHPCTAWVRGRLARMLGTRASSPHTAIHHLGAQASSPPTTPHLGARASSPHTVIHHLGARASRPHAGCTGFQPAYDAPPRSTGVQPAYHGSGNGFLIMLSHPDKCLDCGFHKRADSILQQWLKRCQRFADRFAFTLSQITFPLLRP